jgi:hypothetical protein
LKSNGGIKPPRKRSALMIPKFIISLFWLN